MYRNNTKRLRNNKHPIIRVENNVWWLRTSWSKYWLPKNAYVDCNNIVLSRAGWFRKRRTATQLWSEFGWGLERIYWIWYQKDLWWIRVKWINIETLATPASTWTTIVSWYTVTGNNYVDFINFKATKTTGAVSKTLDGDSSERFVKVTVAMTNNEHIWKLLKIWSEIKLIIGNTDTIIYIQEKFEWTYVSGSTLSIVEQVTGVYIVSPWNNVKIWRWGTAIETLSFTFDKAVLQSYWWLTNNWRLFWIKNDGKVHVSEVWTWEYFQKDSFLPLNISWDLVWISEIWWRIVVYSEFGRVSIVWDNPDNFQVVPNMSHKGALSAWSIASWNNIEFYLSHEWIEFLNSIESATVTEGISLSDQIRKKFESHTDFSWAHGTISNWKYFLNIQWQVYIYDLELSVKFHKPIFTLATYDECSQAIVSNAVAWEWTASIDVDWQLVFGQGWLCYRITDEKIWAEDPQAQLTYSIEFPIQNMGDLRLTKAIQKYRIFFQNNIALLNAITSIKIYISIDEWAYELVRDVQNDFDIEVYLSKKAKSCSIKIILQDLDSEVDTQIEFLYSELEFYFLTKR